MVQINQTYKCVYQKGFHFGLLLMSTKIIGGKSQALKQQCEIRWYNWVCEYCSFDIITNNLKTFSQAHTDRIIQGIKLSSLDKRYDNVQFAFYSALEKKKFLLSDKST